MASLRIRHPQGQVDYLPIVQNETISIGSHSSNDIQLDDDDIDMLHCRILLTKRGLEVHAGGLLPIIINKQEVRSGNLADGDTLRIGNTLFDVVNIEPDEQQLFSPRPADESDAEQESTAKPAKKIASLEDLQEEDASGSEADDPSAGVMISRNVSEEFTVSNDDRKSSIDSEDEIIRKKITARKHARRPGEEEVLKSPFILSLAGISALLLIGGLVYAFMFSKNISQQQYETAMAEKSGGRYAQAIQLFDDFIKKYPQHSLIKDVYVNRSASFVEQEISGGSPDWQKGLDQLNKFIDEQRDTDKFTELTQTFQQYSEKIALGAAKSAGDRLQPALLDVTDKAKTLMERFTPRDAPKTETLREIEKLRRNSEALILKNNVLNQALADIDQFIKDNKPITGLQRRRDLLARYPEFLKNGKVQQRYNDLLKTEQNNVQTEENNHPATKPDPQQDAQQLKTMTVAIRSRTRSDRQNSGRLVIVLAKDSCYGIDTNTGEPAWQYTIGLNAPFIPFLINASYEGCLAFNNYTNELVMLDAKDGHIIWKQPVDDAVSAHPLVHEGQIFAPSESGNLYQLEAETGNLIRTLKFSQPFVGTPLLSRDNVNIYLVGQEEIIYRLKIRPLACDGIFPFGHATGSVNNSLMSLGKDILCSQLQPDNTTKLTVLETTGDDKVCSMLQEEILEGVLQDEIMLRGNQIYFPTRPERVIVYSATDEPGKTPITRIADFQHKDPVDRPIFLTTGPDGKVWMASRSVLKLELTKDGFKRVKESLEDSRITQPIQNMDNKLFISRKLDACNATFLSEAERDELNSSWQTVIGAEIKSLVGMNSANQNMQNRLISVSEAGAIVRVDQTDKPQAFIINALTEVAVPDLLTSPLFVTPTETGYTLISSSDKKNARGWVINPQGQIEQTNLLPSIATGPAIMLGNRVVFPLQGKLHLAQRTRTDPEYDNFQLPTSEIDTTWTQLIGIDQNQFLAITNQGMLRKLQLRNSPSRHIGEISQQKLTPGTRIAYWKSKEAIVTVTLEGKLEFLRASTLERLQAFSAPAPFLAGPYIIGDYLLIQFQQKQLLAFTDPAQKAPAWTANVEDYPIISNPLLANENLFCVSAQGTIYSFNSSTGELKFTKELDQVVTCPPVINNNTLYLGTLSGNILAVPLNTMNSQ